MTYTITKKLIELSNGIPLFEYYLCDEYGSVVASVCCEDLAVRIRDLLNGDVE